MHLAKARGQVGEIAYAESNGDRIEALAREGKVQRVGLQREASGTLGRPGEFLLSPDQHGVGKIAADDRSGLPLPEDLQGQVSSASAEIQHPAQRALGKAGGGGPAPTPVQVGAEQVVEQVVVPRDSPEHPPDPARISILDLLHGLPSSDFSTRAAYIAGGGPFHSPRAGSMLGTGPWAPRPLP